MNLANDLRQYFGDTFSIPLRLFRRTKDLMKRLRSNFSELVDTMELFLAE
ncbi:MAG: hypothetical protein K2N31_10490 [Treponemataceae bacterium]|nr:hypothetical protein [Treponemataceae bacterium]